MAKRSTVAVLVVPSFLIGSALSWWLQGTRSEKERGSLVVVHEVEVAGLCANALQAVEQGRTATVQKVLETRMASAVNYAAERVGNASPVGFPVPELVEGLNRARRYAAAKSMSELVRNCDRLLEFLTRSNVRA